MRTLRARGERRELVRIATRSVRERRMVKGREVGRLHCTYQADWRSEQVCQIWRELVASDQQGHAEHGSRGMGNPWEEGSARQNLSALVIVVFLAGCHQNCKASISENGKEKNTVSSPSQRSKLGILSRDMFKRVIGTMDQNAGKL